MELPQVDLVMKSTASVRDKLKKRREALGSILSGITSTSVATAAVSSEQKSEPDSNKKDGQLESVETTSKTDFVDSILKEASSPPEKKLKLSTKEDKM